MKKISLLLLFIMPLILFGQEKNVMTPELLWSLGKVATLGNSPDGKILFYKIGKTDLTTEKTSNQYFLLNVDNGQQTKTDLLGDKTFVQWDKNGIYAIKGAELFLSTNMGKTWKTVSSQLKDAENVVVSPDGLWIAFSKTISFSKVLGKEIYNDVPKSTAQVYTDLNIRHWDAWNEGKVSHVFVSSTNNTGAPVRDLLENEPYDAPQKPFGGAEDFIFSPDSKSILYVCKKKIGKAYAQSTNTDIYAYHIGDAKTTNLTEGMMGYDMAPAFSKDGKKLAWLSMKRDGYEADKNDVVVMDWATKVKMNVTSAWDETVDGGFSWSTNSDHIFFNAAIKGTKQLFSVKVPANLMARISPPVIQITKGAFDITGISAQNGDHLIVTRTDMNHATELFNVDLKSGNMKAVTHANDADYARIAISDTKLRMVKTTDGKEMGVWVVYPLNFDPAKKYPTLLYCQGGPESSLTQFYSVRWNFQLMAANGYIVVAPNRRGMPGWGVEWNEAIAKDWGGQPMQDYLSAIDDVSKESYVDKDRLGCVGASYGGYSVYMLAGIHNNRFKTFIAHDGLFDMKSWYGTTEELWFANFDLGGNYWSNPVSKSYTEFNPSNYISKWNTPIMVIQGGIDFRVPIEQGLEAFQAAQLKGIKSKLLYLPNENHWVLHAHNGLVWQREFFSWLKETL
ncbi:S9 family peptidase [Pedobacter sp.]|jgi:dipeptidyl aminopeptidase/acylaminoacyl peptidase|uniref:S9 family peptidase n=1 Tax=Pedobacter sp. TaxID=1411316 RepID=UPI002BDA3E87|nr:S9 family peptidase [Pedobacter sp.]HWW43382.1 S9 family peptidase [Pedobacter sp.]